jgi:hypothetical protein
MITPAEVDLLKLWLSTPDKAAATSAVVSAGQLLTRRIAAAHAELDVPPTIVKPPDPAPADPPPAEPAPPTPDAPPDPAPQPGRRPTHRK